MPDSITDRLAANDERRATELRSLRHLITSPTQQAIAEVRERLRTLDTEIHAPDALTSLLVPIIGEVLQRKITGDPAEISATLSPVIASTLQQLSERESAALSSTLAPLIAAALRKYYEASPHEVVADLAPIVASALRQQALSQPDVIVEALAPTLGRVRKAYRRKRAQQFVRNVATIFRRSRTAAWSEESSGIQPAPPLWRTLAPPLLILVCLLGGGIAWFLMHASENRQREQQLREAIASSLRTGSSPVAVTVSGNEIRLTGEVANDLLRRRVLETVGRVFPTARTNDAMTVAEPPPHPSLIAAEIKRVTSAFNQIPGVDIFAGFENGLVTVSGAVADRSLAEKVVLALERIPGVVSVTSTLTDNQGTIEEVIYFRSNSTGIPRSEMSKVEAVANFLRVFPNTRIRIVGYSDTNGSKSRNIPLTLARAAAVKAALVRLGIEESRLQVVGEGNPVPGLNPKLPENLCVRFEILDQRRGAE